MSRFDPAEPLKLAKELVIRHVGGKSFVLTRESQMVIFENETAVAICRQIDASGSSGTTIADLAGHLARQYRVDEVTAERDARSVVEELVDFGVVVQDAAGQRPSG